MMTYEEYEAQSLKHLKSCRLPQDYIDEICQRECIRASYEEDCAVTALLGSNQCSPSGFAYGCHMLYPDYPDSYEEYKAQKKGFDFNFRKI